MARPTLFFFPPPLSARKVLVLLWKCLEENPGFMPFVLKHCDVCELVVPLCFFLFEGRKDPARVS